MVTIRAHDANGKSPVRRRLAQVTSLALGLALFGTVGLSGALAQDDDVVAGSDVESIVNAIIAEVFAEIFGGDVVVDDATVSGGGDINVGGSSGSNVSMGGSGGGVTVGDNSGG